MEKAEHVGAFRLTLTIDDTAYEFEATYDESRGGGGLLDFSNFNFLNSLIYSKQDRAYWRLTFMLRRLYRTGELPELPFDLDAEE
jgi:hypothetical protein